MSALRKVNIDLTELVCGDCGVSHAIPSDMYYTYRREGGFWHCPNGHRRGFRDGTNKTELQAAQEALEASRQREARTLSRLNEEQAQRKQLNAQLKGTKTRLKNVKNRVVNGVCPCCNRTFVNLQRHMHTKHPDYENAS